MKNYLHSTALLALLCLLPAAPVVRAQTAAPPVAPSAVDGVVALDPFPVEGQRGKPLATANVDLPASAFFASTAVLGILSDVPTRT
jgi:hypothetical protein